MTNHTRREWLVAAGAALGALLPARAAMGPNDKFDLLVRNANVLDPSQNLKRTRDIGIRSGQIESIAASIPPERAERVLDARGTPGDARADRPARAHLSVRLGDRHSGRRAGAVPGVRPAVPGAVHGAPRTL